MLAYVSVPMRRLASERAEGFEISAAAGENAHKTEKRY
jgi:hypothetical protein